MSQYYQLLDLGTFICDASSPEAPQERQAALQEKPNIMPQNAGLQVADLDPCRTNNLHDLISALICSALLLILYPPLIPGYHLRVDIPFSADGFDLRPFHTGTIYCTIGRYASISNGLVSRDRLEFP